MKTSSYLGNAGLRKSCSFDIEPDPSTMKITLEVLLTIVAAEATPAAIEKAKATMRLISLYCIVVPY